MGKVNAIDTKQLATYIGNLTALKSKIENYEIKLPDVGECSGNTFIQISDTVKALQLLKDSMADLVGNTVSYLEQRKDSVDEKEQMHTADVMEG